MYKASLIIEDYLNKNNEVFKKNSPLNRDNTFDRYIKLKEQLKIFNIDISTSDINTTEESEIIVYVNIPKSIEFKNDKLYILFLVENINIWPRNNNAKLINKFHPVFTWNDLIINNIKFFKLNLSYSKEYFLKNNKNNKNNKRLLNAIYSKKYKKNSLYVERYNLIKFLENKSGFDLYGFGWDSFYFHVFPFTFLNRFKILKNLMKPFMFKSKNYKGIVEDKLKIMSQYKFNLAFENNVFPGYITEKLFHPMMSGSIPIYYGAPNVTKHIPENCFIDYRRFQNMDEFWDFIVNISDEEVISYGQNINNFLESKKFDQFDSQKSAKSIAKIISKKHESVFQIK